MKSRAEALRVIQSQSFDVCIIGAGATGAGCALDAQLRGLRSVLVDASDFASGSSSASTKLVHGGVRYLQQAFAQFDPGQLKVVRQALRERLPMLENAPHLAHTCEFLVPCFSRFEVVYYGIGLKLYDWFAGKASFGPRRVLSREHAVALLPTLKQDHLVGAVSYLDGQFDDARYCVALVKSFADAGGEVSNYLRVTGFDRNTGGKIVAAIVKDELSGGSFPLRARAFVNATGPFSDQVRALADAESLPRMVPSKGVHILLPLPPGVSRALLIPETEDGRVIFAIPWLGRWLVGTTDDETQFGDEMVVTRAEAEYLLRHLNRYADRTYTLDDIVAAFAGLRPLVRTGRKRTKNLIREHEVEVARTGGLVSILGGKWTTYRAMAEDTIDAVETQLMGSTRPSATRQHRLSGALGYTPGHWKSLAQEYQLSEDLARHLSGKFGMEARDVIEIAQQQNEYGAALVEGMPAIQAEVVYCARREMAVTVEDVLASRLGMQYFDWKCAIGAVPAIAGILARELGWTELQKEDAIRTCVSKMERSIHLLRN